MLEAGYRALKKRLNKYHKFSFKMPREGKSFTPQQKSAITRMTKKILPTVKRVENEKATFIPKPKGVNLENIPKTIKTNKGIFYPQPGAKLEIKKVGGHKKAALKVFYGKIREQYFPFPPDMRGNMELIKVYVDYLVDKYKPTYVRWAIYGFGAGRYAPEIFGLYQVDLNKTRERAKNMTAEESLQGISGVYLGMAPHLKWMTI